MARRFFLVPSDKYQRMSHDPLAVDDAVQAASVETDKILASRTKRLNNSEKRALMDKRIDNLIRLRNEALNRPVKVKMEKKSGKSKKQKKEEHEESVVDDLIDFADEGASQSEQEAERARTPTEVHSEDGASFGSLVRPVTRRKPIRRRAGMFAADVPLMSTTPRKGALREKARERYHDVLKYVNEHKSDFQIDDEGRVYNPKTHKAQPHTNYERILKYLTVPLGAYAGPEPLGTANLRAQMLRNPETKRFIILTQQGRGNRQKKRKKSSDKRRTFKPALWMTF